MNFVNIYLFSKKSQSRRRSDSFFWIAQLTYSEFERSSDLHKVISSFHYT